MGYNLKTIELFLQFTLELGISTPFRCEFEREVLFDLRGPAELKLKPAIFRLLEYQYKRNLLTCLPSHWFFFLSACFVSSNFNVNHSDFYIVWNFHCHVVSVQIIFWVWDIVYEITLMCINVKSKKNNWKRSFRIPKITETLVVGS